MQDLKKEAVHVGYGVRMRMVDDRLRITVPCNKRWRGGMAWVLSLTLMLMVSANFLVFIWQRTLSGRLPAPSLWFSVVGVTLWLVVAGLLVCAMLWFLRGQYVLEIGDKVVQTGRSLLGRDLLSTHEAAGLRRIRFAPLISHDPDTPWEMLSPINWFRMNRHLYVPGRYRLHLDYGSRQPEVLNIAIEEGQVRIIKKIIRTYCPHLYHSSLEVKGTAVALDPLQEIQEIKRQIK